ncbi:hypothetical protein H8356DRAFT_1360409 [Neocallimastix lanati (nom. inval.)]|nr:hypothetical protein H8356DRAFT_1360409 [Neocallimastix sp. JGI-2020a]
MEENLIIDVKKILKYDNSHNHPEKEYDVSLSIMKHKIKDGIEKSSIPFGIKIKPLYNKISKEMEFISKLFRKYNDDIFVNGTFFIAPKITKELNSFYTTSFAILKN